MDEHDSVFDRTIGIMEQIDDLADDVGFAALDSQASFDAGMLRAAESVLRSTIDPDYPGLRAYAERSACKRLNRVLAMRHDRHAERA